MSEDRKEVSGKIKNLLPVTIEGNSHIYFSLEDREEIFDVDLTNSDLLAIIKYSIGDEIQISYMEGDIPIKVSEIKE